MVPKKPFFTIAFIVWLVFVTYSSLSSFSGVDTSSFSINIPNLDKIVHFVFYFNVSVLGVLFIWEHQHWRISLQKAILLMFCFAVIYGIIIEVLQYSFTTDREGDILDAIANSFGGVIGVLTCRYMFSKKGFLHWGDKQI
ncbi:hypothetical protein GH721_18195 [Kriegella sp. EG-1]|nr:hypothetical protein [Flavobacteriaceae bacterium EG-1]